MGEAWQILILAMEWREFFGLRCRAFHFFNENKAKLGNVYTYGPWAQRACYLLFMVTSQPCRDLNCHQGAAITACAGGEPVVPSTSFSFIKPSCFKRISFRRFPPKTFPNSFSAAGGASAQALYLLGKDGDHHGERICWANIRLTSLRCWWLFVVKRLTSKSVWLGKSLRKKLKLDDVWHESLYHNLSAWWRWTRHVCDLHALLYMARRGKTLAVMWWQWMLPSL